MLKLVSLKRHLVTLIGVLRDRCYAILQPFPFLASTSNYSLLYVIYIHACFLLLTQPLFVIIFLYFFTLINFSHYFSIASGLSCPTLSVLIFSNVFVCFLPSIEPVNNALLSLLLVLFQLKEKSSSAASSRMISNVGDIQRKTFSIVNYLK